MSDALSRYREIEFAWALARVSAGGELSTTEEVVWTEAIGNVWRQLSEDEREAVEREPPPADETFNLVDRDQAMGMVGAERTAAP